MDLAIFILGILYLRGVAIGTTLAWCCVIYGVAKIIIAIINNLLDD